MCLIGLVPRPHILVLNWDMAMNEYFLLGSGFNGFGQLNFPNEAAAVTAGKDEENEHMTVCPPHKLMSFSSKPILHFSCAWDAIHVCAETPEKLCSVTTGRWSKILQTAKCQLKKTEDMLRVTDAKDTLLLQTTSRLLATSAKQTQLVDCELSCTSNLLPLSDGRLFTLTDTSNMHQCSIETSSVKLGTQIILRTAITSASCGADHILMLSDSGAVYSFGLGSRGQLGHGDILLRGEPSLIEALAGVAMTATACGSWHSMALSECGDVYTWGWNEHGQLGHSGREDSPKTIPLPRLIDTCNMELNFTNISCGTRHSAAVTEYGTLYTWGWNGYGQLCQGETTTCPLPSVVHLLGNPSVTAVSVHCGHWNTVILCAIDGCLL